MATRVPRRPRAPFSGFGVSTRCFALRYKVLDEASAGPYVVSVRLVTDEEEAAEQPASIHDHALDNLRFIRATLEQAGSFTAVPGIGGVLMGITALGAAAIAAVQPTQLLWFYVWCIEAVVAFLIGGLAMMHKARAVSSPLLSAPGRRFALAFAPAIFAGALLTIILFREHRIDLLPAIWLLLYGCAVMAGGALSVRSVPVMGMLFIVLGTLTLFVPATWGNELMAIGFGGLHIVTGLYIARKHGG